MRVLSYIAVPLAGLLVSVSAQSTLSLTQCGNYCQIDQVLGPKLSSSASIAHPRTAIARWSDYDPLRPGTVVNVATEKDVLLTVQYCIERKIKFFAQNGASAWATTFNIGPNHVVINLRGIRAITFNDDKSEVRIQGGAIVSEVVSAAYQAGAQVLTGNCNCIGTLSAALGGGYSRLMGLYGFGVDNILSMNVVTAKGEMIRVDQRDRDLWWALRGAGANFGIVTSAIMKSYPVPKAQNGAWLGPLIFTEDKLEALVRAINKLVLKPEMAIFMYFATLPPENKPTIIAFPFYLKGDAVQGKAAFASIFAVGPVLDATVWTPYDQINAGSEPFCVKGGRKPSHGAGFSRMDPENWRAIWKEYNIFLQNPGTQNSTVLVEYYALDKAISLGVESSSYAFRSSIKFNAVAIPWYADPALDAKAEKFGSNVRDLWRSIDRSPYNQTYINYANGDEELQNIYGPNVERLRNLKKTYDPAGLFNEFFPLS